MAVRITFGPAENARNVAERGLAFDLVAGLDRDTAIAVGGLRHAYGARRMRVLAKLDGQQPMAVIAMRGDAMHVISLRTANRKERWDYGQEKG